MADVKTMFPDCGRIRFHGPCIDVATGKSTDCEEWALSIRCRDGGVYIHSTTGFENDLLHGIVKQVSYGTTTEFTTKEDSQQIGAP